MAEPSPWLNTRQAGAYLGGRSGRFILREVKAGRLRAARIGGRGEVLTCPAWLDEYVQDQARIVPVRRRA